MPSLQGPTGLAAPDLGVLDALSPLPPAAPAVRASPSPASRTLRIASF